MIKSLFYFLCFFPFYLFAEKVDLNTQIVSVRVYQGAANVTRSGIYNPHGNTGFRIKNIGTTIVDSSVSIRFEPESTGIKIKRINITSQVEKKFKDAEIKQLTEREEALSRKLKVMTEELEAIKKQRGFITTLTPQKKDLTRDTSAEILMNTDAWSNYQKMLTSILNDSSTIEWKILEQLDETREELLVVESKIEYFSKSSSIEHKDIEVETNSNSTQPVKVYFDYIINDAFWYPRYEVKVDTMSKTNQISFFALVRNNTGEDWKNVSLAFSAADLHKKLDLPSIEEWRISYEETPIQDGILPESGGLRDKQYARNSKADKLGYATSPTVPNDMDTTKKVAQEEYDVAQEKDARELKSNDTFVPKQSINIQKRKKTENEKAKEFLNMRNVQSRSIETESNLNEFKNVYESQKSYFNKNDYNNAIKTGKQAMERLTLINPKFQSELSPARKEIEETVRKSALMQANSKITTGLVSPLESSGGYDYRYSAAAKKETLLSDNSFNRVLVSRFVLPTHLSYETAPVKIKSVFLTSNSVSRNKEPLLKGPLDIYVKEDFVTTSTLNNTATGENLKFDLGVEEDIEVERREDIFREKKGFFSGKNSKKTTVSIRLKNRKKEKVSILVVDRIPYTNDPDTKIEIKNLPQGNDFGRSGILKYTVLMSPGETKEIKYEYEILYPDESRLKERLREEE